MKILIQPKQMLGRVVKVVASKSGIVLTASNTQKKESILFIIDEVGSEITNPLCKVGQIIVPQGVNNIVLRDQTIHYITEDLVVMGVEGISHDQLEIDGKPFVEAQQKFHQAANGAA